MQRIEYVNATSVGEAAEIVAADPESRLIAGGTDLIPEMRLGIREPRRLIDIKSIQGLAEIALDCSVIQLGALTHLADITRHPLARQHLNVLIQAIEQAASVQIREQATIGGSLCQESRCWYFRGPFHCWLKGGSECDAKLGENSRQAILGGGPCYTVHPSDPATALVALAARAHIVGPRSDRWIELADFFSIPRDGHRSLVNLDADEVLVGIDVPLSMPGDRGTFLKAMDRAAFGFSLASVCVVARLDGDRVERVRLVLGGVAPIPWRAVEAERVLNGRRLDGQSIDEAADAAVRGAQPLSLNAYKVPLVQGLVRQALREIAAAA